MLSDIPPAMRIDLFSHGMRVTGFNHIGKGALLDYCTAKLGQWGSVLIAPGHKERQMIRIFAGATRIRSEFFFHRNQYADLRQHLARYGLTDANIVLSEHLPFTPEMVEFPLRDKREPRNKQVPVLEYLIEPCMEGYAPSKVVTMQTGTGKTFTALRAVHHLGQRTVLVILGRYIDKWVDDVMGNGKDVVGAFEFTKQDLMVVRGANQLRSLQHIALAGELKAKFIIVSMKTMYDYLDAYEKYGLGELFPFPIPPYQFYYTLKAGVRIIDEVHQDFHCVFRQDIYAHINRTISLSATLESDDVFTNNMYRICWPRVTHGPDIGFHRYVVMKALWYSLVRPGKIRCLNGMRQYSHVKFEQSIMKYPDMLKNYLDMIYQIVQISYIAVREEGQKMLIFCATKEMCTYARDYIKQRLPSLKVLRYVEEDDYTEFLDADISVSTLQSAGTAVDIINLRVTLMTNALSSKQANEQALGRTRPLRDWPDVKPEFLFLTAREIDKHRLYTSQKAQKLDGKILSFKELQTDFRI